LSILLFPEGTRSYGRGLLPFKTGAFRTAQQAKVDIVPICVSSLHDKVKLNRWNNGKIIIEIMAPVSVEAYDADHVRELTQHCHRLMTDKIAQLDAELATQNERSERESNFKRIINMSQNNDTLLA